MSKVSKWQEKILDASSLSEIEEAFRERFGEYMNKDENVFFEGYFSEDAFYLTCILKNEEETFYYPFETSINRKDNQGLKQEDAKHILLDFVDSYFDAYFDNDRDTYIPIDWSDFIIEGIKLYARGQVLNRKLEKMADELLGL